MKAIKKCGKLYIDPKELAMGMKTELEHKDVTGGDPKLTKKIAMAHLKEMPDYYSRLKEMEAEGKEPEDDDEEEKDIEKGGTMKVIKHEGKLYTAVKNKVGAAMTPNEAKLGKASGGMAAEGLAKALRGKLGASMIPNERKLQEAILKKKG